jgi:voltage-gated potassium channel
MAENELRENEAEIVERWTTLRQLEEWLEMPMIVLSFLWLVLVLVELSWGRVGLFDVFGTIIWVLFIADFLLRFSLAPGKRVFLRHNVITTIALGLPAFRMFRALRVFRVARAARGLRLVRIVGTANRSMNAFKRSLSRRGLGYVLLVTVVIALLGAGGMLAFEPAYAVEGGFQSYADALWWTAMLLSTMGSGFLPTTAEGRVLALLLSVYGFAVFGYITASFATFFIGQEADDEEGELPSARDLAALRQEIASLREDFRRRR